MLRGKKAVVIGGSRGIGAEACKQLAAGGAEVLLTYVSKKDAAEAVVDEINNAGGKAQCMPLDAVDESGVVRFGEEVKARFGSVDVLFNNAGDLGRRASLEELDAEQIRHVLDLNVTSSVLVAKAIVPLMPAGSVVINMSSQAGRDGGGPGAAIYGAAKGAIIALTRAWAKEFADRKIRVFAVAPGFIDTDFHRRHSKPELKDVVAKNVPAGKFGVVEDVARAVVYLAGEGNGFMNGVTIDINGGCVFA